MGFLKGSVLFVTVAFLVPVAVSFADPAPCQFLCDHVPSPEDVHKDLGNSHKIEPLAALQQKSLNFLIWNVYKGRKAHFSDVFRDSSNGADLVMLQEATDGDLVHPELDSLTDMSWQMAIVFYMKNNVAAGIVTGTNARPTFVATEQTTDLEPLVNSPKVLLLTKYLIRDGSEAKGEILVINIHGINFAGNDGLSRHLELAARHIEAHHGPVIFAGDFNSKNPERIELLRRFGARFGMELVQWENTPEKKQLDGALVRGFHVDRALIDNSVIDKEGSDHPALKLSLTPIW
jgi:endonuclease/exonuclease/phosphatase (EEP) superfamily protein YafD